MENIAARVVVCLSVFGELRLYSSTSTICRIYSSPLPSFPPLLISPPLVPLSPLHPIFLVIFTSGLEPSVYHYIPPKSANNLGPISVAGEGGT